MCGRSVLGVDLFLSVGPPSRSPTFLNLSLRQSQRPCSDPKPWRLGIAGLHDVNVQDYCDWLKSRVKKESHKNAYQKAADFLLKRSFDLDLVYEDQNPTFLVEQGGVEEGIARRFVKDLPLRVKLCKQNEVKADSILQSSRGPIHLR
ncbi:uncharacterized protein PV06_11709 [Exophiala oligosperma]|uniref:Uncharacterized protein n=1 Tax=Exophiala oligosperma TaxID=215243 RepID=A0A0D2DJW7_9EURO|nr:uncharacterized protein PV06_11709 [Exophiala oligosperma]KIW35989.1 hypothetical protein PV06_11709 [Exophiala oligosperma]